jgi:HEPN domain-containing protein
VSARQPPPSVEWLPYARKDWSRVLLLLREHDPDGAAFHLQQAVEKYLKGWLLDRGWTLRKLHQLQRLLDEASLLDPALSLFRPFCERVSGYYVVERYPAAGLSGPDEAQLRQDLSDARRLILKLFPDEILPT